jgi:peroxiredoxin
MTQKIGRTLLALAAVSFALTPMAAFAGPGHDHGPGGHSHAAPAEETTTLVGKAAPDFSLKTSDGKDFNLATYRGESPMVITFLSKGCPYSRAYHKEIAAVAKEYEAKGVKFVGIMSNSTEKTPEVAEHLRGEGIQFPILDDPGNKVADLLDAVGTPHMYVLAKDGTIVYSGAVNDGVRDPKTIKKHFFKDALSATLAGKPVPVSEPDAFIGCTIKRIKTS